MSTVSTTQPTLPKGISIPKKMKQFLLFALVFGLLMFSLSTFIKAKVHSKHHGDNSILSLTEELKELKRGQEWSMKAIERLFNNQQRIVSEQSELREVKDILVNEVSKIENMALRTQEAYRQIQVYLQQQDNNIKSLARTVEMNKANNQESSQDKNLLMKELRNTQADVANRLESFRKVLQAFEMGINNNNRKVAEDMREIKTWVSENSVSQEDLRAVLQSNPNAQRQLVNEVNNQKNIVNQVAQNSLKQGNEIKEISRVLNSLKEYTLEVLQQLGQQNNINERRISNVEKAKVSQVSGRNQPSNEAQQLATELKNFKEYTMEALQELRAFNNRNTKKINSIKSKESETSMASISEMVSKEVEKFLSNLGEGKLLEKILEKNNISMEDLQSFINIIKKLAEGDINGLSMDLLKNTKVNNNQRQQQKAQKKKKNTLEDLIQWAD